MYTSRPGCSDNCAKCVVVSCVPMAQVVLRKPACHSTAKSNSPSTRITGGKTADGLPGKQSAFGARQQTVRKRRADTAAVEVDDLAAPAAGENHPVAEGIAALAADQAAIE